MSPGQLILGLATGIPPNWPAVVSPGTGKSSSADVDDWRILVACSASPARTSSLTSVARSDSMSGGCFMVRNRAVYVGALGSPKGLG